MNFFKKKKILVTHNGTFHADDIFACATLSIYLKDNVKIIRTRDPKIIEKGDYVFDVGGVYDPSINRFDHHQKGGAGERDDGIPYAAFGLVWKEYGEKICGSKQISDFLENKIVKIIDANDNGIDTFEIKNNLAPYTIQDIFFAFRPSFSEKEDYDKIFIKLVKIAKEILNREIKKSNDFIFAEKKILDFYANAKDKRLIILDDNYPFMDIIMKFSEPIYVVYPKLDIWRVECVRKERYSFENRKSLPQDWAGKRDLELAQVTGVEDAVFCHNGRFLIVAKSKEGAINLAEKALEL